MKVILYLKYAEMGEGVFVGFSFVLFVFWRDLFFGGGGISKLHCPFYMKILNMLNCKLSKHSQ